VVGLLEGFHPIPKGRRLPISKPYAPSSALRRRWSASTVKGRMKASPSFSAAALSASLVACA
jgi:hypothetical protein